MDYIINEKGKWVIEDNRKTLIEPSESYLQQKELEERQRLEEEMNRPKEPTLDDYLLDLDFRLSSIELGL